MSNVSLSLSIYIYICVCMYVYIYIYIYTMFAYMSTYTCIHACAHLPICLRVSMRAWPYITVNFHNFKSQNFRSRIWNRACAHDPKCEGTPDLHNKIPAYDIFARGWVAQEPIRCIYLSVYAWACGQARCRPDRAETVEMQIIIFESYNNWTIYNLL